MRFRVFGGLSSACRRVLRRSTRRWLRHNRWFIAGLAVSATAVSLPLSLALVHGSKLDSQATVKSPVKYATVMVVQQVKRKVYPYSIVPGGADNVLQAKQAMSEPAIRANYADFDLAHLREVTLTTNLTGYVSYRWGDKIYWTAKMLTLHAGEKVFTDGVHIARGRCLNCYSTRKMSPTRSHEPTEKALDIPVEMPVMAYEFPRIAIPTPELPPPPGELTPTVPVFPKSPLTGIAKTGRWFPLIPIIPPIHRHHGPSTPGTPLVPPPTPVVPPVAVVPEPRYGTALAFGLFALILLHRRRRQPSGSA